jgi:hypothetical protein
MQALVSMGRAAVFVAVAIFFSQLTAALYERYLVTEIEILWPICSTI